jgi:hypothetical protein
MVDRIRYTDASKYCDSFDCMENRLCGSISMVTVTYQI